MKKIKYEDIIEKMGEPSFEAYIKDGTILETEPYQLNNEFKLEKENFLNYKKLSISYVKSTLCLFEFILENFYDQIIDEVGLVLLYFSRHAIELILKSIILCENKENVSFCSKVFSKSKHSFLKLYNEIKNKKQDEEWMKNYFQNVDNEDFLGSLFKYSMNDEIRRKYNFINFIEMHKMLMYSFELLYRYNYQENFFDDEDFNVLKEARKNNEKASYVIRASTGYRNIYTFQTYYNDLYKQINGFLKSGKILINSVENENDWLIFPTLFSFRHAVELSLKEICNTFHPIAKDNLIKNGKKIIKKANGSHDLKKIWESTKPLVEIIFKIYKFPLDSIDKLEKAINYINSIDKDGDFYRYTTDFSLQKREIKCVDLEKVEQFFKNVLHFLGYIIVDVDSFSCIEGGLMLIEETDKLCKRTIDKK